MGKSISIIETIRIDKIIDQALKINEANFVNSKVKINLEYIIQPVILIDKNKLLQILVNLIRNSYEAILENNTGTGMNSITIRLSGVDDTHICIKIIDTGKGIELKNQAKIFSYGFTTRKDGHGLGLHNTLLLVKELEGTLTFESKGWNQGTTFSVVLPIQQQIQNKDT